MKKSSSIDFSGVRGNYVGMVSLKSVWPKIFARYFSTPLLEVLDPPLLLVLYYLWTGLAYIGRGRQQLHLPLRYMQMEHVRYVL